MLTVVVEAGEASERLAGLLAQLTSAAIDGLVREVVIAGGGPAELLSVLREETGAELAGDLGAAIAQAKSARVLILPASLTLRADWLAALGRHLRGGGGDALVVGEGGPLSRRGYGVLIARAAVCGLAHPDLKRVRRHLARSAVRLA
jgi:hypothetical protein